MKPAEGNSQQGWEEQGACPGSEARVSPVPLQDRLHSLAEAERLLDELTQEKMQVGGAFTSQEDDDAGRFAPC